MSTIMVILNIVLIAGVVVGMLGLLSWGIISDRPFATHVSRLAVARAERIPERRKTSRERSGYRGPNRRVIDVGA